MYANLSESVSNMNQDNQRLILKVELMGFFNRVEWIWRGGNKENRKIYYVSKVSDFHFQNDYTFD